MKSKSNIKLLVENSVRNSMKMGVFGMRRRDYRV